MIARGVESNGVKVCEKETEEKCNEISEIYANKKHNIHQKQFGHKISKFSPI